MKYTLLLLLLLHTYDYYVMYNDEDKRKTLIRKTLRLLVLLQEIDKHISKIKIHLITSYTD